MDRLVVKGDAYFLIFQIRTQRFYVILGEKRCYGHRYIIVRYIASSSRGIQLGHNKGNAHLLPHNIPLTPLQNSQQPS
jgi:hypothetical protein